MNTIIQLIIKYLPYLITAGKSVPQIITFIAELHTIFARTKIWTEAQQLEFDSQTELLRNDPAWIITD